MKTRGGWLCRTDGCATVIVCRPETARPDRCHGCGNTDTEWWSGVVVNEPDPPRPTPLPLRLAPPRAQEGPWLALSRAIDGLWELTGLGREQCDYEARALIQSHVSNVTRKLGEFAKSEGLKGSEDE